MGVVIVIILTNRRAWRHAHTMVTARLLYQHQPIVVELTGLAAGAPPVVGVATVEAGGEVKTALPPADCSTS